MTAKRRIMRTFAITEISAVDHPAQKGAVATIIKRDGSKDAATNIAKMLLSDIAKRWIDPADGAISFDVVLQNSLSENRYRDIMEEVCPLTSALNTTLNSIAGDANMDAMAKQNAMRDSVESFMATMRSKWPDVEQALAEDYGPAPATTGPLYKGDADMDAKELEAQVATLTKQLETATKASKDAKLAVDAQKATADAQKALDDLTAKHAEVTAKLAEETAKAAMSDAEKAHMATLSGKDKFAFMTATPEERAKMMAKAASGDEVVTIEGQSVSKRAVGEAQFEIIKRQATKIAANETEIAKERTAREDAEYTKRADAELSHLPGEAVLKVKALRVIDKADAEVKAALTKMLEAGDKAISAAYTKLGAKGGDALKNGDTKAFEKRIDEIASANKSLSRTEAMSEARKKYPEEFKAYQGQQ